MNWMIDGIFSLLLILVTMGFGLRLQSRIANTNIFNQEDRFAILVRLNTTLAIMTLCAICELAWDRVGLAWDGVGSPSSFSSLPFYDFISRTSPLV
jgi:dipeptide/tripeptide permease